ncbi:MAG: type II toxin-antitoxin system RelE/ParE family toxin [Planctomycetales bacterium]|nr:type II toxin-antitoxin system RelE/ParE family toxin [Planctomycetales bacterium]
MASFKVILKPSVEKDLRALPQSVVARVWRKIEELQTEPLPRGSLKLEGAEGLHRVHVGDFRIIYGFDPNRVEVVIHYSPASPRLLSASVSQRESCLSSHSLLCTKHIGPAMEQFAHEVIASRKRGLEGIGLRAELWVAQWPFRAGVPSKGV